MTADNQTPEPKWSASVPHVRKAIAFVKRKKNGITAEELVAWDAANGRRLFTWDNDEAATEYRKHEARLFMNRFRAMFDKMRVRAFIHVQEDSDAGIDRSAYQMVEAIAAHDGMRSQVIRDIAKRMKTLASELAMWKLTAEEQAEIFERLRAAINGSESSKDKAAAA